MSQENVEIVRRLIEAWSNHDREEMAGYLHPEAVFHSAITNVVGETFHGRDQASGIETVRDLGGLIHIRDGLVVSQWIYLDRSDALKAAGLER